MALREIHVELEDLNSAAVALVNWRRERYKRQSAEKETKGQQVALDDLDHKLALVKVKFGEELGGADPGPTPTLSFDDQLRQLYAVVKEKGLKPPRDAWQVWDMATGGVPIVVIHRGKGKNKRVLLPDGTTELVPVGELRPMTDQEARAA